MTPRTSFPRPRGAVALPIVARMFGEQRLYLSAYNRNNGALCCWSADQSRALVFDTTASALGAAAFAAVFWSADCGVIDGDGCVLQPAAVAALKHEPRGVAKVREFARVSAAVSDAPAHCDQHNGYTDGCAACYSVHLARSH